MIGADQLKAAGTSPPAIARHYDLSDGFFELWLGPGLVYSCALWDLDDPSDTLAQAQVRKLDHFAHELGVVGGRVLDVGCGWGALLDRFVRAHGAARGVGLTLSPAQEAFARRRDVPGVDYHVQSWVDHQPDAPYDAITCIEATEHFASDALDSDAKVEVYRAFFDRCAEWLRPGGRVGLQLICLDDVGHEGSRPGRGPLSELIRTDIFPESMPASLGELVLGWETGFRILQFLDHPNHYRRTFRAWGLSYRSRLGEAEALVGPEVTRTFSRYFAAGEACFRLREHSLYRVVLERRDEPKRWVAPRRPSDLAAVGAGATANATSASAEAVRSHYDLSNDFYRLWLGPTMMYSSGMWAEPGRPADSLDEAELGKIDVTAALVLANAPRDRVLDVGCGWGGNLRRLAEVHQVGEGVGLTLSPAQVEYSADRPVAGTTVRLESWADHVPDALYDAIVSFGAFEHFARDGTTGAERVEIYRRFFGNCWSWLHPGGRLALETIAHDDAPDTAVPLGRGPLGDFVLEIFPESISPHLTDLVLGFEPFFEVEVLRSDAADFARTCRAWLLGLRANEAEATALVGAATFRRWHRYLAASEAQFRMGTITNYRVLLRRRDAVRW